MGNHLPNGDVHGPSGHEMIAIFGAKPKANGEFEADQWFRIPKKQLLQYCNPESARLAVHDKGALYLMKTPKNLLKYIVQWMHAGGKDPKGNDVEVYPSTNLSKVAFLQDAAYDLGIDALIERTNNDLDIAQEAVKRKQTRAVQRQSRPVAPTYVLPYRPAAQPRASRNPWFTVPHEIAAQDNDGIWIVHTRGRLRPCTRDVSTINFEGELQAFGLVSDPEKPDLLPSARPFTMVVVARWRGTDYKIVVPANAWQKKFDKEALGKCGHLQAQGLLLEQNGVH